MSFDSQYEEYAEKIRRGKLRADEAQHMFKPFKTKNGCFAHMLYNHDDCNDCQRRAREVREEKEVNRLIGYLWKEQWKYDAAQKEKQHDEARRAERKAASSSSSRPVSPTKALKNNSSSSDDSGSGCMWMAAITGLLIVWWVLSKVLSFLGGIWDAVTGIF